MFAIFRIFLFLGYMTEYRMSKANKALVYFLVLLMVAGAVVSVYLAAHQRNQEWLIVAVVGIAAGYLFFRMAARVLLTIDESAITICNGFWTTTVRLDDIAGTIRGDEDESRLLLVRKNGENPVLIPDTLERKRELRAWLKKHYGNIEKQLAREVKKEVLQDDQYGTTEAERAIRFKQARKLAAYGTSIAFLIFFWVLLIPRPFEPLMLITLAIPLVAVWLTWYQRGLLRMYFTKKKPYPSLFIAVFFAEVAALAGIYARYDIYQYDRRFWVLVIALTLPVMLVWTAACRRAIAGEKNRVAVLGGLLLAAGIFCFSALLFANCAYDHHKEEIWRVSVDGKYEHMRRHTYYHYLELSSWGRFTKGTNFLVPRSLYQFVNRGDSVNVHLHPGNCGIPWYEVRMD